jgi:hypothetical protein
MRKTIHGTNGLAAFFFSLAAFTAFVPQSLHAQDALASAAQIVPGTDLVELLDDGPDRLSADVHWDGRDSNGTRWIYMEADTHAVAPFPLARVRAALQNYGKFPLWFKRCLAERDMGSNSEGKLEELSVGITVFGITFESTFTALAVERVNTSEQSITRYEVVSSDGKVRDVAAQFYLQAVDVDGKPCTYVRFTDRALVIRMAPLQQAIMSMFVRVEHENVLEQLIEAVESGI